MIALQDTAIVQNVMEVDGVYLVRFPFHGGLYKVANAMDRDAILSLARQSRAEQRPVCFTYDSDMTLIGMKWATQDRVGKMH